MANQHGLSRNIPTDIMALVRQLCGFGCVVCGAVPYDFDHFRVPYAEAKIHDPEDIVLLCDKHHRQKGAGILSNDDIELARRVAPLDRPARFKLDVLKADFGVHWPRNHIEAQFQGIVLNGKPVLSLRLNPENELEPVVLDGLFHDLSGAPICRVQENALEFLSPNIGDLVVAANRFTFRTPLGRTALDFTLSSKGIQISKIFHVDGAAFVFGNSEMLKVGSGYRAVQLEDCSFTGVQTAISIVTRSGDPMANSMDVTTSPAGVFRRFQAVGGETGIMVR